MAHVYEYVICDEYVGKKEAGLQPAGVQDKEIQYHPLCSSRI